MSPEQGPSQRKVRACHAPYGAAIVLIGALALTMSSSARVDAIQSGLTYKHFEETIPVMSGGQPGRGAKYELPVSNRRVKVIVTTNYQDGEGIAELNMFYNLNNNTPTQNPSRLVWVGQHGDPTDAGPAAGFTKDADVAMAWCGRTHSMRIVSAVTNATNRLNSFQVQNLTGDPRKVIVEMMY